MSRTPYFASAVLWAMLLLAVSWPLRTRANSGSSPPATEASPEAALRMVRALTRDPRILKRSSAEDILGLLPACRYSKDPKEPDLLVCSSIPELDQADARPGPDGNFNFYFRAPVTCKAMYRAIRPNLGKPKTYSMTLSKCEVYWSLHPRVKGAHAYLGTYGGDPKVIVFRMGVEQGP